MDVYIRSFSSKSSPEVINVEPDATIKDLKNEIGRKFNIDSSKIKLIFQSKILSDDTLVISVEYNETTPIVYYAPKATSSQSPKSQAQTNESSSPPSPEPSTESQAVVISPTHNVKTHDFSEETIKKFDEMGFERQAVIDALTTCHGNEQVAADLLLTGDTSKEGLAALYSTYQDQNQLYLSSGLDKTVSAEQLEITLLELASTNPEVEHKLRAGQAVPIQSGNSTYFCRIDTNILDQYIQLKASMGGMQRTSKVIYISSLQGGQMLSDEDRQKIQELVNEGHDISMVMQYYCACGNDLEATRNMLNTD